MANLLEMMLRPYLDADKLIKKYNNIKTSRSAWERKWQLIQDQIFPDYRDYENSVRTDTPKTGKINAHTSAISGKINKVVSLLSSQICDPSVKWLDLKFSQKDLNHNYAASAWLYQCTEALYELFAHPKSRFYTSNYSFYLDWFTLGTACKEIILRKDNQKIQFNTISMQDIYIENSGYGEVDTIFRRFNITAKQAMSLWGENNHPRIIQQATQDENTAYKKKNEFFEVIMPNPIRQKIPSANYISCVIDKTNKHIVDIGTHSYSPYIVARFFVSPGETYGRSYVWNAMPDIRGINRLSKRIMQGADFVTNPVIAVKESTSLPQGPIAPGAFIQGLDVNGRPSFQQLNLAGDVSFALAFLQQKLEALDEALVCREIFPEVNSSMTATEVNERKLQASNRIRPLLVLLESEDLYLTVLRSLKLLEQLGKLPPFPYEEMQLTPEQLPDPIEGLEVTFSGQLSKMQKLQDIVNSDMLVQKSLQVAQVDPTVLDRVNLDELIARDAEIYGVDKKVINSDEVVQEIRAERARQEEAQQQAQSEAATVDNFIKLQQSGVLNDV